MQRVALVTGGTRGIGHAISLPSKTPDTKSPPTTSPMIKRHENSQRKPASPSSSSTLRNSKRARLA